MKKLLLILLYSPLIALAQNNYISDATGTPVLNSNFQALNIADFSYANNNINGSSTSSIPLIIIDSISAPADNIQELAFDGEFLWVCGAYWNTIYKISIVTGAVIDSIPTTVYYASGLTFDGNNLWITDKTNNQIHEIDINTGNILQSFPTPSISGSTYATGLAWNGNLWHNDPNSVGQPNGNAQSFCLSSVLLSTLQSNYNPGWPTGLAWDGQYLWCTHSASIGIIQKYDISTFTPIDSIITPWIYPNGLTWDGSHLWVADNGTDMIYKIDIGVSLISGCTDSTACNYDALATTDDSSCVYSVIWQQSFSICDGDSVVLGSVVYHTNGNYIDTLTAVNGCDSIVYINILIDYNTSSYDTLSVSASIVWNGMPLNVSGDYSVTLINSVGCDSIVNLNLTITTTGISDVVNNKSNLVKITDMLGQEITYRKYIPLFFIYDDGTVEKKVIIE